MSYSQGYVCLKSVLRTKAALRRLHKMIHYVLIYRQEKMYLQCSILVMLISKDGNVRIMYFLLLADLQSARHRTESKANEEVRSSEKKQRASLR